MFFQLLRSKETCSNVLLIFLYFQCRTLFLLMHRRFWSLVSAALSGGRTFVIVIVTVVWCS